ncbi:MAG: helix-turn-helix domain-containing protein [Magnetospirillum sp.]|nr:helix-turn-helix domain-containing protein [Magnetospirillum sp.]
MCGLSLKTVSRVLQELKRKGIVGTAYTSLRILDFRALERAASAVRNQSLVTL